MKKPLIKNNEKGLKKSRTEGRSSIRLNGDERFVAGKNAVLEALRHNVKNIKKVYYQNEEGDSKCREIFSLSQKSGILLEKATKDDIKNASKVDVHQGFLAVVKENEDYSLKSFLKDIENKERVGIVAVDEIQDPHNLGAIFRASEVFGVDAVMLSKNRGAQITPTVAKSSVGATEIVRKIQVNNLLSSIKELKKQGFWIIVADVNEKAVFLNEFQAPKKFVLIMGEEGPGVKKALKNEADFIVKIPQNGQIDSLNVSQATAIILYALTL